MFAQVECSQSEATVRAKQSKILIIAVLAILISLIFTTALTSILTSNALEKKNVELEMVTASSYAINFKIPAGLYEKFKSQYTDEELNTRKVPIIIDF